MMNPTSTETFSVSLPPTYEYIRTAWESITAEHRKDGDYLSFITLGLSELSFYNKYNGDDHLSRFRASCLEQRGVVEVMTDKTLPVAGLTANIRTAHAEDGYFYYFGLVQINDVYGYTIIGDCDTVSKDFYEPLFDETFQSLQYFGNPVEAMAKQQAGIDEMMNKYKPAEPEAPVVKIYEPFVVPDHEYWKIGEHQFSLTGESQCSISDGDGALYIKIEAQAPQHIAGLTDDYSNEKVYLQFYFKGIYNAGVPTGKFLFEEEREASYLAYLWKGGFDFIQKLSGEVTLQDGWLGIQAYFNEHPLKLAVKITPDLNWTNYRFLSAQEVSTAPPEIVHQLWLTDPYTSILQETIYPLTQLQSLSIDFRNKNDFKEIPTAVKRLKALKNLSLTGVTALESLPLWLGDLKALDTIRVSNSQIAGIHPYIFQLPELTKLYLSHNQLESIHPTLPEKLETLVVSYNQLTSVPASVTRLTYLNIEHNPLEKLPAGLENIPTLNLELEKKIKLLDYTYKGAGPYDDSRFFAKNDPALLQLLETKINLTGLDEFKEGLIGRSRKAVALDTTEEDTYDQKGNHRFGGLPDLPPGVDLLAAGMQFIAQINCADIAALQDYLPRTGVLFFFIKDQEELDPQVVYYDGDLDELQSAKELDMESEFTPFRAIASSYASIPSLYNASTLYPELAELSEMYDETEELEAALREKPAHSMNSYVFKQHDTPEMEAVDAKRGKPEDWMVLLRVSSDRKTGFCFGDAGEIYFVIHKSDLEKKDFSNVYCGLESS
ncbi:DUF1963 domain-containing protein [[Flexibacter] sp. ATCC 35208]|uniref:DUF1963 domain-containing protein n=1 Tax=[Flexibacter] sp. ATCC 35208 TaxID=1936242 RepID=UPI001F202096|nr:DUF1963 domain-containing protein [[Flexibacter] sp. ATCC 35208]